VLGGPQRVPINRVKPTVAQGLRMQTRSCRLIANSEPGRWEDLSPYSNYRTAQTRLYEFSRLRFELRIRDHSRVMQLCQFVKLRPRRSAGVPG
jgi:hypothetical protein